MRKIASQIPESIGRLLQAGHVKSPPTWYGPVMANPPPLLAPLRSRHRTELDHRGLARKPKDGRIRLDTTNKPMQSVRLKIRKITYREDSIRRQFFVDFPFEAFRPTTLVELRGVQGDHPIRGKEWTSLAQRGDYPTVEDTVEYTIKLQDEGHALSKAYKIATEEFVKLRAKREMLQMASEYEARHYGATFGPSAIERHFMKERQYLDAHLSEAKRTTESLPTRVSWKKPNPDYWTTHVPEAALDIGTFAGGYNYVSQWARPKNPEDDMPEPIQDTAALEPSTVEDASESSELGQETPGSAADFEGMDDLEFLKSFKKGKD